MIEIIALVVVVVFILTFMVVSEHLLHNQRKRRLNGMPFAQGAASLDNDPQVITLNEGESVDTAQ